jgi:Leucine-rich repeat (LRR) protein
MLQRTNSPQSRCADLARSYIELKTLKSSVREEAGAFDLPSILTGAVVVGVLTAGVLSSVFGIIPFAQDESVKQDLSAVRTAQGVARMQFGGYMDRPSLTSQGLLKSPASDLTVISTDASYWCANTTSETGKRFSASSDQEPREGDLCAGVHIPVTDPAPVVDPEDEDLGETWAIADDNLRMFIFTQVSNAQLGAGIDPIMSPDELRIEHARLITSLELGDLKISSLDGLQHADWLTYLNMNFTSVDDLTPLAGAENLQSLYMFAIPTIELSPLAGLSNLSFVQLDGTYIRNWEPVAHVETVEGRPLW